MFREGGEKMKQRFEDADFEDLSDTVTSCRMLAPPEAEGGMDQLLSYSL